MTEIQPKYVLTQDTFSLFSKIDRAGLGEDQQFTTAAQDYFALLDATISQSFQPTADVMRYAENEINGRLTGRIDDILQNDPEAVCVCLDRCLLDTIENDSRYADRFFRFSICRTANGERVPRQGSGSFANQLRRMKSLIPDIETKKITVVDDGLFSGGTMKEFVAIATRNGIRLPVDRVIGFIGSNAVQLPDSFPSVEIMEPVENLYEWIDIRDFSPLGGKKLEASRTNRVSSSLPYLYPWSDGSGASFHFSQNFFTDSVIMINAFKELVIAYQQSTGGKPLTFRELVRSGFPLPTNIGKTIPVSINDTVCGYLDLCLSLINKERERPVFVFDMDGTLYQLDGNENGFRGSTLDRTIQENAGMFIQEKEKCSVTAAKAILQEGMQDPVGLSNFLSERYGISRADYFNEAWNIDPEKVVANYDIAVQSLRMMKANAPDKKFILLTSAPRIWAENVLDFLNVDDCFEAIYTGEQYKIKGDIFLMLAGRYNPKNIISIGDQWETDILPAQEFGIRGIKVNQPDDLLTLLEGYA